MDEKKMNIVRIAPASAIPKSDVIRPINEERVAKNKLAHKAKKTRRMRRTRMSSVSRSL